MVGKQQLPSSDDGVNELNKIWIRRIEGGGVSSDEMESLPVGDGGKLNEKQPK